MYWKFELKFEFRKYLVCSLDWCQLHMIWKCSKKRLVLLWKQEHLTVTWSMSQIYLFDFEMVHYMPKPVFVLIY